MHGAACDSRHVRLEGKTLHFFRQKSPVFMREQRLEGRLFCRSQEGMFQTRPGTMYGLRKSADGL